MTRPRPAARLAGRVVGGAVGLGVVIAAAVAVGLASGTDLVVRDPDGAVLLRATLREGDPVVLRYRNSLYGSLAEERFVVRDGALRLVELAADERAVLDEYYEVDPPPEPTRRDARTWRATPRHPVALTDLAIAATDLGERTLLLPDRPALELWRHVADERPTVHLHLAPGG